MSVPARANCCRPGIRACKDTVCSCLKRHTACVLVKTVRVGVGGANALPCTASMASTRPPVPLLSETKLTNLGARRGPRIRLADPAAQGSLLGKGRREMCMSSSAMLRRKGWRVACCVRFVIHARRKVYVCYTRAHLEWLETLEEDPAAVCLGFHTGTTVGSTS